jgi:HD superfamily phosphohydrolase
MKRINFGFNGNTCLWLLAIVTLVLILLPVSAFVRVVYFDEFPLQHTSMLREILDRTICDTAYAKDFSISDFELIQRGDTLASVKDLIGDPLFDFRNHAYRWGYRNVEASIFGFSFDRNDDVLSTWIASRKPETRKQIGDKIDAMTTRAEVEHAFGKPSWKDLGSDSIFLNYSGSPSSTHYWRFVVILDPYSDLVLDTVGEFYFD